MSSGSWTVLVMTGIMFLFVLIILLLGLFSKRSAADYLDWKPTRSPEAEAENELDDVAQMLEAANERRRRRGEAELTEEGIDARVRADQREMAARREELLADREIDELLAQRNAKRRARGEPEQTLEEFRASLEADT
jgi:hypothetical protein